MFYIKRWSRCLNFFYVQKSKNYWESDIVFIEYDKTNMSEIYCIFPLDRHMKNDRRLKFRFQGQIRSSCDSNIVWNHKNILMTISVCIGNFLTTCKSIFMFMLWEKIQSENITSRQLCLRYICKENLFTMATTINEA